MGALLLWIGRGLAWGGSAAIGYFINDLGTGVANATGIGDKVVSADGKTFKPWYVAAVAVAAGVALFVVTKMLTKKKLFSLLLLVSALTADYYFSTGFEYIGASLLLSIAASITDSKSIPYCPEFISFNIATVPTNFKIEVIGDGVVYGLDGTGITNLNGIRLVGTLPANQYVFQIADGFINKNTTFTITNAQAAQLDIYGWSNSRGRNYVLHNTAKAFALASLSVKNFLYAAFPSAAATDSFMVTWADRTNDTMTRLELQSYLGYKQSVTATRYNLDNYQSEIREIQFRGAADQSIYYTRGQKASGAIAQSL